MGTDNGNNGTDNGNEGTDNGSKGTDNGDEGTGTRNGARHTIESGMIPCDDAKISRPEDKQTNTSKQTNARPDPQRRQRETVARRKREAQMPQ
jgi:hypothetical protein